VTAYIIRRLLWIPVILLAVALVTLVLGLYGPGDPAQVILGLRTNPEAVARLREQWGLDQPFLVQYGNYLWRLLHLDFGESFRYRGQAIAPLIFPKIWVSVQLAAVAMALSIAVGLPIGILAALRRATWVDTAAVGFTLLGISTPTFVIAPILQWFFVRQLHLLPTAGWDGIFSVKIIMPAVVLGMGPIAALARQTRVSVLEVLDQDYVRTARAKGLTPRLVTLRHILKNAMIPVLTLVGFMLADLPAGALITELIFGIPGIGPFAFEAIFNRDYPVIMATTLVVATSYVVVNLLVDIAYTFLDPRIRYA
jgi:peptide/nickel transport system permease protein